MFTDALPSSAVDVDRRDICVVDFEDLLHFYMLPYVLKVLDTGIHQFCSNEEAQHIDQARKIVCHAFDSQLTKKNWCLPYTSFRTVKDWATEGKSAGLNGLKQNHYLGPRDQHTFHNGSAKGTCANGCHRQEVGVINDLNQSQSTLRLLLQ